MASSIEVRNLRVERGSFTLEVAELAVRPREVFAILGSTGSGKTVLLESIVGAYPLSAGCVFLDGRDASTLPIQQRHLGIVYQDYALFPHMNVYDNVAYGLRMHGYEPHQVEERVWAMLRMFSIGHLSDRYPGILSGGESQRVALARALVLEPELLLLDEPFSALDPVTKKRLYDTIRDVHKRFDCTIVFVTHDFTEAGTLADRVGIVLNGKLRAVRSADALFDARGFDSDVRCFLGLD